MNRFILCAFHSKVIPAVSTIVLIYEMYPAAVAGHTEEGQIEEAKDIAAKVHHDPKGLPFEWQNCCQALHAER
jgi:N-acetyl-anhydromuramyl-L-alanine amidase AmpD